MVSCSREGKAKLPVLATLLVMLAMLAPVLSGCTQPALRSQAFVGTWADRSGVTLVINADKTATFSEFPAKALLYYGEGRVSGAAKWIRVQNGDEVSIEFTGVDMKPNRFNGFGCPGFYMRHDGPRIYFWVGDPDNNERVVLKRAAEKTQVQ